MLSYFAQELEANKRKGFRNEVSEPKLLQGDLAEAWREGGNEYATVAMRFSLLDATVDGSGRVISGSWTAPQEVTEIWTFRRPQGGTVRQWELSAIQQDGKALPLAS
jgi:predicted lipid-binding transport protein (Tim44 family)